MAHEPVQIEMSCWRTLTWELKLAPWVVQLNRAKSSEEVMNNFVQWLGPSLRQLYKSSLYRPANWRMITMLSDLDEQAEETAEKCAKHGEVELETKVLNGGHDR